MQCLQAMLDRPLAQMHSNPATQIASHNWRHPTTGCKTTISSSCHAAQPGLSMPCSHELCLPQPVNTTRHWLYCLWLNVTRPGAWDPQGHFSAPTCRGPGTYKLHTTCSPDACHLLSCLPAKALDPGRHHVSSMMPYAHAACSKCCCACAANAVVPVHRMQPTTVNAATAVVQAYSGNGTCCHSLSNCSCKKQDVQNTPTKSAAILQCTQLQAYSRYGSCCSSLNKIQDG
jgi:hypothetical protein